MRAVIRAHSRLRLSGPARSTSHSRYAEPARYAIDIPIQLFESLESCAYVGSVPARARWRRTAARRSPFGRPEPVSFPSSNVAYPSWTQRGALTAIGPSGSRASTTRWRGLREGRSRCSRWVSSCSASSSIQSLYVPTADIGAGGLVHSTIRGAPRSGRAIPFACAVGSAMTTSTVCGAAYPTSAITRERIASSFDAASSAHASSGAV